MGAMAGTAEQDLGSIVESAAEGDEVAFGRIVAAYHEQMYCICVVVCRDRSLAEEAVQSAWSSIWQRLDSLREPEKLRPWVVAVAVNEAKSLLRKRRRRSEHEVRVDTSDKPGGIDPATGVAVMDLRIALDRLDPDDRALLAMRYVAGFDSNELSAATGISPSGVRSRIERIRTRLRQELGDD